MEFQGCSRTDCVTQRVIVGIGVEDIQSFKPIYLLETGIVLLEKRVYTFHILVVVIRHQV